MKNIIRQIRVRAMRGVSILGLIFFACCILTQAQTTTFTYQGRLTVSSASASGTFDLEFKLFDAGGTQIGAGQVKEDIVVTNGIFTVQLDADLFEANAFDGGERLLEIGVRRGTETGAFTTLTPRQPVTSTPYAVRSLNAATADLATNSTQLGGTTASEFVQTGDTRLTDNRPPTSGSGFYIQNQNAAAQTSANFNVSGDGTLGGTLSANAVNSATQFNIAGSRVLGFGNDNLLIGAGAGDGITTGNSNTFSGSNAGRNLTTGSRNAFFGMNAGFINTTGSDNAFFGLNAGNLNTTGSNNTIIGYSANTASANLNFAAAFGSFARVSTNDTIVMGKTAGTYNGVLRPADAVQIPGSLSIIGTLNASGANLTNLNASNITSGTLDAARIPNLDAAKITTGTFDALRIPNFDAGKITSGTFDALRIPNLDAGKITSGIFDTARLPSFDAAKITSGTFDAMRIPVLDAGKITSGVFDMARIPNLDAAKITTGTFGALRIPNLDAGKITSGIFDAARIPDLGASYIRNQTTQQTGSFNILGNGTVGGTLSGDAVNSATQYNIGGNRILIADGVDNLFAGLYAGAVNTGTGNAFFGRGTGAANTTGNTNSFFGTLAGENNTTGFHNSFFGALAGNDSSTGSFNSFFGIEAGSSSTTGRYNTFLGSNSAGENTTGNYNTFVGGAAGLLNTTGSSNVAIGYGTVFLQNNLTYATVIGSGAVVRTSNTISLGRASDVVQVDGNIKVDGALLLNSDANNNRIYYNSGINGIIFSAGDNFRWFNARNNRTNMVLDTDGDLSVFGSYKQISDARYKTNVQTFAGALDSVKRLRGVTFNWKPELNKSPNTQIGFIAQEVETVLPELVLTDEDGYKTVSYANAVPVLVEAIKEQQTQIERQQKQIDELKQFVCQIKPDAEVCKTENK